MYGILLWADDVTGELSMAAPKALEQGEDGLWRWPGHDEPALPKEGWYKRWPNGDGLQLATEPVIDSPEAVLYMAWDDLQKALIFAFGLTVAIRSQRHARRPAPAASAN